MSRGHAIAIAAAVGLAAGCLGCRAPGPDTPGPTPVLADLAGTDPAVAALLERLQQEAREDPGDAARHAALGMGYEVNGLVQAAADSYALAARLDPDEPRWMYFLARTTARLGAVDHAIDEMQQVTDRVPGYASAWLYLGHWQLDLGRTDDALASFSRARTIDPSSGAAVLGLARVRLDRGEVEEALELLEPLGDRVDHPYVSQLLGRGYRMAGDTRRAREVLAGAGPGGGEGPPRWSDPWDEPKRRYETGFGAELKQAQALFQSGATDDAVVLLERLRTQRPADRTLLNNLSAAYSRAGRTDEALAVLQDAIERHPGFFPFRLNLAGALAGRGDFAKALVHVERALEINPTLGQAHEMRGGYLLQAGRQREALESYEAALRFGSHSRQVLVNAAALSAAFGRWGAAAGHAERLTRLDPGFGSAWVILGRARAETGDFAAAEEALGRARELIPGDARLNESRRRLRELRGS